MAGMGTTKRDGAAFDIGYTAGFRAGAEAMREKAANIVKDADFTVWSNNDIAKEIRALPIPEAK